MVVDLPLVFVWSHVVDKCVQQHVDPGDTLGKDKPDVNHLDIGRRWKAAWDAYEQGSQDQQRCEVHGDNGPEIVCP